MEIKQTTDYDKFVFVQGNRKLNEAKMNKIKSDIGDGFNLLPYCPIIVNEIGEKLAIIDGQHRYQISKDTGHPVYYVVCDKLTIRQIALLNSRAEKWRPLDYLECYIGLGVYDYKRLKLFMKNLKVPIKLATDLLMFMKVNASTTEIFQTGEFKCNFYEEAEQLVLFTEAMFSVFTFSKDRYLIGAVKLMQDKGIIDWSKFQSKLKAKPNNMALQKDIKGYILNIERIYNDGAQNRVLLT